MLRKIKMLKGMISLCLGTDLEMEVQVCNFSSCGSRDQKQIIQHVNKCIYVVVGLGANAHMISICEQIYLMVQIC